MSDRERRIIEAAEAYAKALHRFHRTGSHEDQRDVDRATDALTAAAVAS